MEQVGLSATLRFNAGAAISQMRKTTGTFAMMASGARTMKAGLSQVKAGFAGANIVGLALGVGIAKTVKDFADFDFQMTKAISYTKDGAENMDRLRTFAKKMGAETFFTAKQAAEGIEVLGRTGMKTNAIMSALPKVLQLAAAESLDLSRAAEIVTKSGNMFGLGMEEAGRITDILAFTSKNTATNVNDLAEGMRYVGTKAGRGMNISMEQTVGVLGLLANVAADASVGGTVLNNALVKIGKNAKRGSVRVGKFKATIVKTFDPKTGKHGVNLVATMLRISKAASKIKDPVKRAAALTKLLGIRGEKASLAFSAAFGPNKVDETAEFFRKLQGGVEGSTKALADAQIKTVAGQFKIFKSAVSGVSIAVGRMILTGTPFVPFMKRVTVVLGDAASAMSILSDRKMDPKAAREGLSKLGRTGVQVAIGLQEGFKAVKDVFSTVGSVIKTVAGIFGVKFGGTLSDQIRMVSKTIAWGFALKTVGSVMGRLSSIAKGTFQIIRGGLSVAMTATGGIARVLGKSSPLLARVGAKLPGIAGKLAGALTGAEKLTAQPVRVVNFDEAGLGGAFQGPIQQKTGMISGLAGFIKKTALATRNIKNLGLQLAAKGGLVAAALGAGLAIGTLADKVFGLSDKISDRQLAADKQIRASNRTAMEIANNFKAQIQTLKQLEALRAGGTKALGFGGRKVGITREFAAARLRARLAAQGIRSQKKQDEVMKGFTTMLAKFPTREEFLAANKDFTIVNEIKLDGKVVARSVAVKKEEQGQRRGTKTPPGKKRERRVR